jgi:small subunit ribosomal protein S1
VDIRPIKDVTPLLGIKQPFQILKMDKKQGNVVVSRRAIIEESRQEARDELLAQIKEGQTMQGIVKNITDYGAFIDLGSIDGLLHVTDISWSRISHPSEVLSIGQELDVQIIKYNPETKRISLGVKQLGDNPWDGIDTKYSIGTKHTGTVSNITDYGAFVELEEGVEGLVHVSEISWTKTNVHPRKLVQIGDEVEIAILDIDVAKHRISLGIKQCKDNPWKNFADNNKVGDIVEGQVRNVVDFGLFVGLDDEIDGLVHLSDISWASESDKLLKDFNKNDATKVKILAIDIDKQRISLGIKQLDSDPLGDVFSDLEKGATVTCTITDVHDDGIDVVVKDKLPCFIKRNDLAMDRVEQRTARFAVGERVDAKIVKIEKDKRNLSLSIRALEESEHKAAIKEYGSVDSGASLGDILGLAMNKAKNEDN